MADNEVITRNPFVSSSDKALNSVLGVDQVSTFTEYQKAEFNAQQQEEQKRKEEEAETDVGFVGGFWNTWAPKEVQKYLGGNYDFFSPPAYTPTDAERTSILELFDYNLDRYNSALWGAQNKAQFDLNVALMKEVDDYRKKQSYASIWNNLLSGAGSMAGDPLSYTPVGGGSLVARVGLGAVSGVVSGQLDNWSMGDDNSAFMDFGIGMAFGGTIEGAAKLLGGAKKSIGEPLGDVSRRATIQVKNFAEKGEEAITKEAPKGIINDLLTKIESKLPSITVQGAIDKLPDTLGSKAFKENVWDRLGKSERGDRSTGQQFSTDKFTAEEYRNFYRDKGREYSDSYFDYRQKLFNEYNNQYSYEDLDHLIKQKVEGIETPLDSSKNFQNAVKEYQGFYNFYGGALVNGKMIKGVEDYFPHTVSFKKAADFVDSFGSASRLGNIKLAKEKIANLLLRSLDDPKVLKQFQKIYDDTIVKPAEKLAEDAPNKVPKSVPTFEEWVTKEANSDALGHLDQGEGIRKGFLNDADGGFSYNYQKSRLPWKFTIEDTDGFSVDKLQADSFDTMQGYTLRVSGDLGLNKVFGVTSYKDAERYFDDLLNDLGKSEINLKTKNEQTEALRAYFADYYGRSMRDPNEGDTVASAFYDVARNLTFFTKNAFMGFLNHFETAEAIKGFGASFIIKSIPGVERKLADWSNGVYTADDRHAILNQVFGNELQRRQTWREINNRNIERFTRNNTDLLHVGMAKIVAGTSFAAGRSPFTRYLAHSQNSIVSTARGDFLGSLVRYAHEGGKRGMFLSDTVLKRLGLKADKRFTNLVKALKASTEVTPEGGIKIKDQEYFDLIERDMNNLMTLRRLGDYVASEVIQRDNLTDTFLWRGSQKSPWMNLLTQFKSFAIRSYNKRLAKSALRAAEGDALGQFLTVALSGALGTAGYIGQSGLAMSGMNDEQRKNYLKYSLGVDSWNKMGAKELAMVGLNGIMRSSVFAMPALIANMAGFHTGIKSTTTFEDVNRKDFAKHFDLDEQARQLLPAYGTISGLWNLQADARNLAETKFMNKSLYTNRERERIAKSFGRSIKAITPNAPYLQQTMINFITDNQ